MSEQYVYTSNIVFSFRVVILIVSRFKLFSKRRFRETFKGFLPILNSVNVNPGLVMLTV